MGKTSHKVVSPDNKIWYGTFKTNVTAKVYMKDNYPFQKFKIIEVENFSSKTKWIKLTDNNVPKEEVLAIGYMCEMMIGFIGGKEDDAVGFVCKGENDNGKDVLTEVSHFITCGDLIELL